MKQQSILPATISISLPLPIRTPKEEAKEHMKEQLKLLFHNNSPRLKEIPIVSAREIYSQNSTRVVSNSQINISTKLAKIVTVLKDAKSFDWKERIAKIHETIEVVDMMVSREQQISQKPQSARGESVISTRTSVQGEFQVNSIDELLKALRFPIQAQLLDSRSSVLKEACLLLTHFARQVIALNQGKISLIEKFLDYFMSKECLFKCLASGKTSQQDLSHSCLKSLFSIFSSQIGLHISLANKVICVISEQLQSKNTYVRQRVAEYFASNVIPEIKKESCDKIVFKISQLISQTSTDANDVVRKYSQQAQTVFATTFPNYSQAKIITNVKPTQKKHQLSMSERKPKFQFSKARYHSVQSEKGYERDTIMSLKRDKSNLSIQMKQSPISHRLYQTINKNLSQQSSKDKQVKKSSVSIKRPRTSVASPLSSSLSVTPKNQSQQISLSRTPHRLDLIKESSVKTKKKPAGQLSQINVSPLNYALRSLKSRKSNNGIPQQSQSYNSVQVNSSQTRQKSILSPRSSPTRHSNIILRATPQSSTKLEEKSLRVYESLRTQQRYQDQSLINNNEQSSQSRSPISISIKVDLKKRQIEEDDQVRIVNQEDASNCSSLQISHQSSPISYGTTTNKTLQQYISSISPSPSRLKLKTQISQASTSTFVNNINISRKQSPNLSAVNTPRQSIEQALKDAHSQMPTKRITALMFIQRQIAQEKVPSYMLKSVFKVIIDTLSDKSMQIAKLCIDIIKVTVEIQPQIFQPYIQKLLQKLLEIMSQEKQENGELVSMRESLIIDLIRKYSPLNILTNLLQIVDLQQFLSNSTFMINSYEIISTIIQQIQQLEDQSQPSLQLQQSSQQQASLYDSLLLDSTLLPFIISSVLLSRNFPLDAPQVLATKETLYRLSKTLLELLYCVSSQSAFIQSLELHISSPRLSQLIQVIELQTSQPESEIDPELYSLLQSVSMENEPQPALTYHSSSKHQLTQQQVVEEAAIQEINSLEKAVRMQAVKRLAQIKNKIGEIAFMQAVQGKLNNSQISMIKTASVMFK